MEREQKQTLACGDERRDDAPKRLGVGDVASSAALVGLTKSATIILIILSSFTALAPHDTHERQLYFLGFAQELVTNSKLFPRCSHTHALTNKTRARVQNPNERPLHSGNSCIRYRSSAQVCLSFGAYGNPPPPPQPSRPPGVRGVNESAAPQTLSAKYQQLARGHRPACLFWSASQQRRDQEGVWGEAGAH